MFRRRSEDNATFVAAKALGAIETKVDILIEVVRTNNKLARSLIMSLDQLRAEVARNRSIDESALALIQGLALSLEELVRNSEGEDIPASEVQALADDLKGQNHAFSLALSQNTPQEGMTAPGGVANPDNVPDNVKPAKPPVDMSPPSVETQPQPEYPEGEPEEVKRTRKR